MALTAELSNHFKYQLQRGGLNLKAQAHSLNLTFGKCDTGVITMTVAAGKFHRGSGSFLTDGFCVGQEFISSGFTDAANNGRYVITAIDATDITVAETLVNEGGTGDEQIQSTRNDTITRASGSFITDGFEIGDKVKTNSANAANQGLFIVRNVIALKLVIMPEDGTLPNLTGGTEASLTIGTYLIYALLMRNGFVFNKDDHATLTNIKAVTGAFTPTFVMGTKKITRASGSYVTDGFVPGNKITVANSVSNNGTLTIAAGGVAALEITVEEALVDEVGSGDETLTADDELTTGSGYTQQTKLTGVATHTEDDTNNRGNATFASITWTPSAAATIGPTPGIMLVNKASDDNTIIGYGNFGGNESATDPTQFTVTGLTLRES